VKLKICGMGIWKRRDLEQENMKKKLSCRNWYNNAINSLKVDRVNTIVV